MSQSAMPSSVGRGLDWLSVIGSPGNGRVQMQQVYRAKLNNEGRLVIPAVYRKELGLKSGQEVMVKLTQDGLLITTFDQALKGFQDDVAALVNGGTSLVQELLADRQREATKETSG